MGAYVLGVDGGGTKSHFAVHRLDGSRVCFLDWGTTNHEMIRGGYAGLQLELEKALGKIEKDFGIGIAELEAAVFGLAGVDTAAQHRAVEGIIKALGFKSFVLCNDSFLGVKAGSPTGSGVCVINGTGCTVAGIYKGRMLQVGGQGFITSDPGGGSNLGRYVLMSAYNALFRRGEPTILADYVLKLAGTTCRDDYIDLLKEKMESGTLKIKDMNRLLFDAANQNDAVALGILRYVGREMGTSVGAVIHEMGFEDENPVHVVLAGSINAKGDNPAMLNALKDTVHRLACGREIAFTVLQLPPVSGAVAWALECARGNAIAI